MVKIVFKIKEPNILNIQLIMGTKVFDETVLTISQGLDSMLIMALDNLVGRNKIERLSIKRAEIAGKLKDEALSDMILKTVKTALKI